MANEQLTKLKGGMLRYRYAIDDSGEVAFDFNTLAEVGEPYQQWFKEEIQRRGWTVEFGCDLEEKPYVADFVIGTKEPTERTDLYLPRNSFKVGITYVGDKGDIRRLIGIGREYAPHGATTDKTWDAYELLTPELPNHKGHRKGFSEGGLPVYQISLTAFRFWARQVVVLNEEPVTPDNVQHMKTLDAKQYESFLLTLDTPPVPGAKLMSLARRTPAWQK